MNISIVAGSAARATDQYARLEIKSLDNRVVVHKDGYTTGHVNLKKSMTLSITTQPQRIFPNFGKQTKGIRLHSGWFEVKLPNNNIEKKGGCMHQLGLLSFRTLPSFVSVTTACSIRYKKTGIQLSEYYVTSTRGTHFSQQNSRSKL